MTDKHVTLSYTNSLYDRQTGKPVVLSAQCQGGVQPGERCGQHSWSWCDRLSGGTETPALPPLAASPWSVSTKKCMHFNSSIMQAKKCISQTWYHSGTCSNNQKFLFSDCISEEGLFFHTAKPVCVLNPRTDCKGFSDEEASWSFHSALNSPETLAGERQAAKAAAPAHGSGWRQTREDTLSPSSASTAERHRAGTAHQPEGIGT